MDVFIEDCVINMWRMKIYCNIYIEEWYPVEVIHIIYRIYYDMNKLKVMCGENSTEINVGSKRWSFGSMFNFDRPIPIFNFDEPIARQEIDQIAYGNLHVLILAK